MYIGQDEVLYSYGSHYPMARRYRPYQGNTLKDYIFMTNGLARGFNSLVGFAINGFIVKGYSDGILTIGCHRLNVKQLREVLGL